MHRHLVEWVAVEPRGVQRGADLGRQQRGAQVAAGGERLLERLEDAARRRRRRRPSRRPGSARPRGKATWRATAATSAASSSPASRRIAAAVASPRSAAATAIGASDAIRPRSPCQRPSTTSTTSRSACSSSSRHDELVQRRGRIAAVAHAREGVEHARGDPVAGRLVAEQLAPAAHARAPALVLAIGDRAGPADDVDAVASGERAGPARHHVVVARVAVVAEDRARDRARALATSPLTSP